MKSLLHVICALILGLIVSLTLVPSTGIAKSSNSSCRTPVALTSFLLGLDYQGGTIVYARRGLKCKVEGMSVIFKISDITWLRVDVYDEEIHEEFVRSLPVDDPLRQEWKADIGKKAWGATLGRRPVGENLFYIGMRSEDGKLFKSFPKPISEMIKALKAEEKFTTVRARVMYTRVEKEKYEATVGAWVSLTPYKVERRSG